MADEENPKTEAKDKSPKEDKDKDKEEKPKKDKKDDDRADHEKNSKDDRRMAQLMYMIFFTLACVVAIVIKFWGTAHLDVIHGDPFASCNGITNCLGNQAVYRLSWASFFFFMLMCLATIFVIQIHYNYFLPKFIVFVACIIGWFFLPNSFFDVYQEIARVLSFFFLVLQLIILIDFANDIHEYLINPSGAEGDPEMTCGTKLTYMLICVVCWGGALAGCVCMYVYLPCKLNQFYISVTLILGVLTTILSVLEKVNRGLLVPSVIFAYGTFICWQAISSNPNTDCNWRAEGTGSDNVSGLVIGIIIAIVSLVYACNSAANAAPTLCTFGVPSKEQDPDQKNYFFHFVMAMGCMYMAMILTNWGVSRGDNSNENTGISTESMWIKISSQWLAYLLYFWSLIAPICFPDRDFSSGSNRFRD